MMKPIEFLDQSIFSKVSLYKTIFNPFQPLGTSPIKNVEKVNKKFQIVNLSMSQNSNCEYIYGYNNQVLDVISCVKNQRYRFILPIFISSLPNKGGQQKNMVVSVRNCKSVLQIRNRLLIILVQNYVYVHDLVRHYNRLLLGVLNQYASGGSNSLCQVGVCSFDMNEHYIYRLYSNSLVMPQMNIQLYIIDMSDNLNVRLVMNKEIKISSGNGKVLSLCRCEKNISLSFCVLYQQQQNSIRHLFIYSMKKCQNSFQIIKYEVDELMVSICKFTGRFNNDKYCNQQQINISNVSNNHQICKICLAVANQQNIHLIYSPKQNQFLIIITPSYEQFETKTIIVEHLSSIMNAFFNNDNKIIILDENLSLWFYNQYYQQPMLIADLSTINQQLGQNIQYSIVDMENRIGLISSNLKIYILYPQMVFPKLVTSNKNQSNRQLKQNYYFLNKNESTSIFLSIQTQNFSNGEQLLLKDPKKIQIYEKFGCYLNISTNEPIIDIRNEIIFFSLEYIKKNIQKIQCFIIKLHQIYSICQSIFKKLNQIKYWLLGSKYDYIWNNHFWLLSELIKDQRLKQDLFIIMENLLKCQGMQGWEVLEIVFTEFKLKTYLVNKCKEKSYSVLCTTHFSKCKLFSGCSCPFKRMLFYLILSNQFKTNQQFNIFFQHYQEYHQIVQIMSETEGESSEEEELRQKKWEQKILGLANQREKKVQLIIKKELKKINQRIDKKWEGEFKNCSIACSNTKETIQLSNIFTSQLPYIYYQQQIPEITYLKEDDELDSMISLNSTVKQILDMKLKVKKKMNSNNRYFQEIYNISKKNNLLYSINILNKLKQQQFQLDRIKNIQKIKICIILIKQLYNKLVFQIYIKKFNNKQNLQFFDQNIQLQGNINQKDYHNLVINKIQKSNIYRKYWILISQLIFQALSIKYNKKNNKSTKNKLFYSQLKFLINLAIKSIISSKYLLYLPNCLQNIINFNVLLSTELNCLLQCIIQSQINKFYDYSPEIPIKNYKFRYSQQVWSKGIQQLIDLKVSQETNNIIIKHDNGGLNLVHSFNQNQIF